MVTSNGPEMELGSNTLELGSEVLRLGSDKKCADSSALRDSNPQTPIGVQRVKENPAP